MPEVSSYKDDFWDAVYLTGDSGLFGPKETTYLKVLSGGYLMRHFFHKGRRYTASAILFFPDSMSVWSGAVFEMNWEHIKKESNVNFKTILHRLKVPEGWVVKEFFTTIKPKSGEGKTGLTMTYVPDHQHQWEL